MTLGKRIKDLRMERSLSQPELADFVGIEQSYLSKIENDKSIPSNDIFRALLDAFKLTLDQFMHSFDESEHWTKLSAIPDVESWLNQRRQKRAASQRHFLYMCCMVVVVGITLFYAGKSKILFDEVYFEYESRGVIFDDEPDDIFSHWHRLFHFEESNLRAQKEAEMALRSDTETLLFSDFKGRFIEQQVEGGRRVFHFDREFEQRRPVNAWLEVAGVFCFSLGLIGFVVERRLYG